MATDPPGPPAGKPPDDDTTRLVLGTLLAFVTIVAIGPGRLPAWLVVPIAIGLGIWLWRVPAVRGIDPNRRRRGDGGDGGWSDAGGDGGD